MGSKPVVVLLEDEFHEGFKTYCETCGFTMSGVIRTLIDDWLKFMVADDIEDEEGVEYEGD